MTLCSLILSLLLSQALALKVMVDPGHGGTDAGANRNGFKESEVTLNVALKLYDLLSSDDSFQAALTRKKDVALELEERVELASQMGSEIFISIHANASADPKASGAEFYFQNQLEADGAIALLAHQENQKNQSTSGKSQSAMDLSPFSPELRSVFLDLMDQSRIRSSFTLSKSLREHWQGRKKSKASSLKQAPFHVVSRTPIPSSLIEIGFLTNSEDFKALQSEDHLKKVAESLYNGLKAYKNSHLTVAKKQ